jgi:plastocyanin
MKNFLWALGIVVILGGGYYLWQNNSSAPVAVDTGSNPVVTPTPTPSPTPAPTAPLSATITYNGDSFSPQEVLIRKGGTVTWVNSSGGQMWVASAQHPSHIVYAGTSRAEHCPDVSGTAFDQCAGQTGNYSFKFEKAGTWGYHDHLNSSLFGKVIVE